MKKILLICTLLALLIGCTTPRVYKENRFTKQFQEADSMFNEKYVSIRPRACFFPLFSFLPLWLHYNLNPLCVQY